MLAENFLLLAQAPSALVVFGTIVAFVLVLVFLGIFARYAGLWLQSKVTGAGITFPNLVLMSIRRVNPAIIVRAKIMAVQAGLTNVYSITTRAMEAHYLAGGNVLNVVRALIAAHRARLDLDWQTAAAIDLAGRDVLDAVRTSVYPKVIDCPDPRSKVSTLDAVCADGIQLKARARVTVRTNVQQLVGGATEETVIARVGQGIVQAIGSTSSYKLVLENPDKISETVLAAGLEANTAFEIVSIDIADIDVGDNIGARLQADQAEADMRIAQAKAEQRRANAYAREQEMRALVQENRAKVVAAEAEIPRAMADALRNGTLGIMDYYELKNVQADTKMREAIADLGQPTAPLAPAPKTEG